MLNLELGERLKACMKGCWTIELGKVGNKKLGLFERLPERFLDKG